MLEVKSLTVRYGGNIAVDGISIVAESGKLTTVIGSNGAGKTTLLRAICGLLAPEKGDISVFGNSVCSRSPASIVRQGVTLVPEGRELFPRMTVYENLISGAYLIPDKAAIRQSLQQVYCYFPVLERKSRLLARNLSGGEQQMIAFGRALMSSPRILLLDEPSIGLAPLVERELIMRLKQLTEETGLTVLLVEQNANLALSIADYGYVLELGKVIAQGAAQNLKSDRAVRESYLGH